MANDANAKQKPARVERLGACKVVAWANETKNGGTFFSIVPSRTYRTDKGWEETSALNASDLPIMRRLLARMLDWILEQPEEEQPA